MNHDHERTNMETSITVFGLNSNSIRTTQIDGKIWFSASDVCSILKAKGAASRLDDEDRRMEKASTGGGKQKTVFVSEGGVYKMIIGSRNPATEGLKRKLIEQISCIRSTLDALDAFETPEDYPDLYVYAIRNTYTGNIKLGISRDPLARMRQLQAANDCQLELMAYKKAENRFKDEVAIHGEARPHHVHGEWFGNGAIGAVATSLMVAPSCGHRF